MEKPKLSVIVPVYNVKKYLKRCLDSLQRQTYPNLEFILVDDGSTDGSERICDEYAADDRFRVIHQENQGVSAARNMGLALATGKWIGFVDSDDYVEPDMFSYLFALTQRYGADMAQCSAFWENSEMQREMPAPEQELCISEGTKPLSSTFWKYFSHYTWCKLFAKHVVSGIAFDPAYVIGEDVLFNLMALRASKKIVFGDKAKYHYWQNPESVCHGTITEQRLTSARQMFLYAEKEFRSQKGICEFCKECRLRNNLDICSKIVCNGLEKQYAHLIQVIRREMRGLWQNKFEEVNFSKQEKIKTLLIGYGWGIYRFGLPKWKKWGLSKQKVR